MVTLLPNPQVHLHRFSSKLLEVLEIAKLKVQRKRLKNLKVDVSTCLQDPLKADTATSLTLPGNTVLRIKGYSAVQTSTDSHFPNSF